MENSRIVQQTIEGAWIGSRHAQVMSYGLLQYEISLGDAQTININITSMLELYH